MAIPSEAVRFQINDPQCFVRTSRLFYVDPAEHIFEGWYFKVRGPRFYGPYPSRREASGVMKRVVNRYCASNDTSGR